MSTEIDTSGYASALMESYRPALSASETTHWFSTDEVYTAIKGIDPTADLDKADVYQMMQNAGFRYQNRPGASGCDFRWMLQAKT